ncbi:isopenicillin N synthase family dioxygenase [Calothrix rhizosoleniae]|uniref:isopenicillin N synthase family dioxygenase n=2 Tax=Calothrix rhizosoleniae TaxID=888997 RepID=UPI00190ED93F|nr:isopenicillin N synthase family oxygenase [Calothrix rhizosoleniae]
MVSVERGKNQMEHLPIISLSELAKEDLDNQEIKKLYNACYECGFFYLKDHGVSTSAIEQTIDASKNFFHLPESIKGNYGHDMQKVYPPTSRGYVPLHGEYLHEEIGFDPKEVFDLGLDKPLSDKPFTGPNILPDDTVAPGFATSHYNLQQEIITKVVPKLLRAIALALGLEATWFDQYFNDLILIHRTIYYPENGGKAGKHTDNGIFTVLIQEQLPHPSLRVHTKDSWIDVPCLENTFIINLGDMLQMWTNGLFVSTPHEVIHELSASRISIPFFIYPNIDTIIEPFGKTGKISSQEVMLKNFESIWVTHKGAGRAQELK